MTAERKIHLPCRDPYTRRDGWRRTECGRVIGDKTRITEHGVDAATCETCRTMYDFGVLVR